MKHNVAFGTNVYPSPTAGRGERLGRTPFRRCIQCGLPNDTRKTAWGDGDGLSAGPDNTDSTLTDWTVTAGCRFCGSKRWLKRKPHKLPDDSRLPASGNRVKAKRSRR